MIEQNFQNKQWHQKNVIDKTNRRRQQRNGKITDTLMAGADIGFRYGLAPISMPIEIVLYNPLQSTNSIIDNSNTQTKKNKLFKMFHIYFSVWCHHNLSI